MKNRKWTFEHFTSALGDTGDYNSCTLFTNGKDTLTTNADTALEIEDEELEKFCEMLDCMPDLWSAKTDEMEFNLSQAKKTD